MSTTIALSADETAPQRAEVLRRLHGVCREPALAPLAARLDELAALVHADLAELECDLSIPEGPRAVQRGARHLLALGGKRLRPLCLALAARAGAGFDAKVRSLAVAVELVHAATLLHDDVVDLGDTRRGGPSTRALYGNAVSIFAGDWLLIEALRRVRSAAVPGTLERLLDVIEEMILAESLQLEARGRLDTDRELWERVARGKTAALFRWAMFSGARAGGLSDAAAAALEQYGLHLGIAFQAVDDLLDLSGDPRATGKALFADLREGKMTYPLILALERDPDAAPVVRRALDGSGDETLAYSAVAAILERTGALQDCRALAETHAALAVEALARLPSGPAIDALATVAFAVVARRG